MAGYEYNYLLKLGLQKKTDGALPPDVEATPAEINTLQGINTEKTVQQQLDGLQNYADLSVSTWAEFLAAVAGSQSVPCRIHFINNITATSVETLDLSNCQVFGHYNKWLVNGNTITLTGNYASFNDVWFQGAANGSASTPAFVLQGTPYTSCSYYFDNCRLYNFLETDDNTIFARIVGGSGASIHTILIRCVINGESTDTNTRTLAIYKVSGAAVSLKVDSLFYSGKPQDTNKLSMQMASGAQDMFISDGSCVYTGTKPTFYFQWGNAQASDIQSAIQTAETNAKNLANASGILDVANGGTGGTTTKEARFNLLNDINAHSQPITDTYKLILQYTDVSSVNGAIFTKTASSLWSYIKSKIFGSTLPANAAILKYDADTGTIIGIPLQPIATADAQHQGVAESSDVANYISSLQAQIDVLKQFHHASITDVATFQSLVPNTATSIVFDYKHKWNVDGYTRIGYLDSANYIEVWQNDTNYLILSALPINAPAICAYLLYNYAALTSLLFNNFDTSNVTDMSYMFDGCEALTLLDLTGFDTSNVTTMSYMFHKCLSLASLQITTFDTSNVKAMSHMFSRCLSLTAIDLSSFNTSAVTSMLFMFGSCYALLSLDLTNFNTANVLSFYGMFYDCTSAIRLVLSNFNTANATNMHSMFLNCNKCTTIIAQDWTLNASLVSDSMFSACSALIGGNGTAYDANHIDASYAHIDVAGNPGYFTAPPSAS